MTASGFSRRLLAVAVLCFVAGCGAESPPAETAGEPTPPPSGPVTVYDARGPSAISPVLEAWRAETGERFTVADGDGIDRIPEETDLLVAGSLAQLWAVAEADDLRPVFSPAIDERIPDRFRDPESRWVALSYRARVIAYDPAVVTADELAMLGSYASLGDERWRDRLCLSSSRVDGNRLLVAWLIERHGVREAEVIVRRWRDNLHDGVAASDEDLVGRLDRGECALGIVGSDRLAGIRNTSRVSVHWFGGPGNTVVDVTGAGVSRHAANADRAGALMEWLTSPAANALLAADRREFPVNVAATPGSSVSPWTDKVIEPVPLADLGFLLEDARLLAERAGYP